MNLPYDLISQFAKITKDKDPVKKETTVYGTVVSYAGVKYVKLDGSDLLTPVSTTVDTDVNDRVTVLVKNHTAIVTGNLTSPAGKSASITVVADNVAEFEKILADVVTSESIEAVNGRINTLEADNVTIKNNLSVNNASIKNLEAADVTINNTLTAQQADIDDLKANTLTAGVIRATYATIASLDSTNANVDNLLADVANIDTLIFGSASGDTIQTSFANSVIAQLGDAQIKSAMIESISASKITAGDIITNNVRVKSEDGSLLISDETMQISDSNRVRVQIGKDAANDYSINIWDQNGNLMFSKGGITDSAIKEAIIRNDMVSDTANIAAHKLDIDSLFEEINGSTNTIKSTKVYLDDEKQTLDVAFKSLSTTVTDQGTTISSQGTAISVLQGNISSKIWQQDIDTAKSEMSTQYSTLEQDLSGFKTSVSETYATQTALSTTDAKASDAAKAAANAQYDIDSLEIGGRNLYLNTTDEETTVTFTGWQHNLDQQTHSSVRSLGGKKVTISGYINNVSGDEKVGLTLYVATPDTTSGYKQYHNDSTAIAPGESGRVVNTFNLNGINEITAVQIRLRHYVSDASVNTVTYHSIKLEVGNKVTDWTPAPEDVDTDIAAVQEAADNAQNDVDILAVRVTNAETNISQNAEAINLRATKTEVSTAKAEAISAASDDATVKANNALYSANANTNALLANYSTTSEMNAAIELTAESITSEVTALNQKVDDIEIGGRNLYCNTSDNIKTVTFSGWQSNLPDQTRDIIQTLRGRTVTISGYIENVSGDEKVGLSLHIATPDNAIGYHQCHNESTAIAPGESGRVVNTFILPEAYGVTSARIMLRHYSSGAGESTVNYHSIKMEFGDYATDWTPAPEDVDARIESAESSITQLSDRITTNVTETTNLGIRTTALEQTSTDLTFRIDTAEDNISEAAKTATDYLHLSSAGLVVGQNPTNPTAGNTLISTDGVTIRKGTAVLTEFKASSRTTSGISSAAITSSDSTDSESDGVTSISGTVTSGETRSNVYIWTDGNPVYFNNGIETDKVLINDYSGIIANCNMLLNGSLVDRSGEGILTPLNSYGNTIIGYGRYQDGGGTHVYGTRVKAKTKNGFSASVGGVAALDTNNSDGNATFGWHLYEAGSGETNIYGYITSLFAKDTIRLNADGNTVLMNGDLIPYDANTYNIGSVASPMKNIYLSTASTGSYHGMRVSNGTSSYNVIGVNENGYLVYGNTHYSTNLVCKSTTTTNAGYSFKVICGDNPDLTLADDDARLLLCGGTDGTSRYIGSMAAYKRTYSSAANMLITENGVIGRSTSSSMRYKTDISELGLDTVKGLYDMPVCQFKYREGYMASTDERYGMDIPGFIAEYVADYFPIACDHITDANGESVPEMWNSQIIIPALLKLIQDLNDRLKTLEERG